MKIFQNEWEYVRFLLTLLSSKVTEHWRRELEQATRAPARSPFPKRHWPKTLKKAVDRLIDDLSPAMKQAMLDAESDWDWHLYGIEIRGEFGLWEGNTRLIESCGAAASNRPAEDASDAIIVDLLRRLAVEVWEAPGRDPTAA